VQCGFEERRRFWLQHKVIILARDQKPRERLTAHPVLKAMTNLPSKIGSPLAEVIVDVYDRYSGSIGASLESCRLTGSGQRLPKQFRASWKFQVVNKVD